MVRAVLGNPPNTFMEALTGASGLLSSVTADFRPFLEQLYFISFFETLPLQKTGNVVVDQGSATLGLDPAREKQIGLEADHCRMCKFPHPDDPTYQQVENNVAEMVKDAIRKRNAARAFCPMASPVSGSVSNVTGNNNVMMQIGRAHHGVISGASNETRQFGQGNRSTTDGSHNKTTQIYAESDISGLSIARQLWWHWQV
ncbi:ankyrin repeat domain-containing [Fusarium albosuccineum]|uniref:Ankyrin repeat domain-containing n=1 Tax=Fusarium albosuccineum TaxID=1237068 RepID=A0A8H4NXC5_9HYPO|nr:ankyrin repeat domain-containing [Fusarium albosuccineum]